MGKLPFRIAAPLLTAFVLPLLLLPQPTRAVPIQDGIIATICDIENEPAATLLLPYFEVDLGNSSGVTTLVTVSNAAPFAVLVHYVLWSDLAVPVLDFNVYLTGYDQQQIDLRDVIVHGTLPQTASTGQDPSDTISPKGSLSQDLNFASCQGILPPPPVLPAIYTTHLAASLTGHPSVLLGGQCAGRSLGDNVARGYMTMDTVNNCSIRFPGDPGYFAAGGTGDVTNQNVLFGDFMFVNAAASTVQGFPLVHIQASATDARVSTPGSYTFYGTSDGWNATDNREPLPTTFGARYLNTPASSETTQLIVWRDPKVYQGPFTCPAARHVQPSWFPLGQESIVIFDSQEQALVPATSIDSPTSVGTGPYPAAVQRTSIGGPLLPVPFTAGWVYLNLNTAVTPAGMVPPVDPQAAQAWVASIYSVGGAKGLSTGIEAMHFDSACSPNHFDPTD